VTAPALQSQTGLGRIWTDLGRNRKSLAHFEAVLRIKPGFQPAREWIERLSAIQ
jgi:hypothetical protein